MSSEYTGGQLRDLRESAGLKAIEIAAVMGVHASRISQIEALAHVTRPTAQRYIAAVGQSQLAKTTQAPRSAA